MTKYERERRILELWHKLFVKARGAAVILQTFTDLKIKIQLFGRQLLMNNQKKKDDLIVYEKSCPWIIMPNSTFKVRLP